YGGGSPFFTSVSMPRFISCPSACNTGLDAGFCWALTDCWSTPTHNRTTSQQVHRLISLRSTLKDMALYHPPIGPLRFLVPTGDFVDEKGEIGPSPGLRPPSPGGRGIYG